MSVIEPSGFRTDWSGRSSVKTLPHIPDYVETLAPVFAYMGQGSGKEEGDPKKAAEALITIVESENPPLRLLLGNFAYQTDTNKFTNLLQSIEEWKETTINTDFRK